MLDRFTWYKQSSYRWRGDDRVVYIDPWQITGDPEPADVIFLTHAHYDHYSPDDLGRLQKDDTQIVAPHDIAAELTGDVQAVAPGDAVEAGGVKAQAVPAYNTAEERLKSHPKSSNWVGYILELGGTSYYFSGDTDHLPELESVAAKVAFVCVGNETFTMGPQEAADLVKVINPEIAVPNHYAFECGTTSDAEAFKEAAAPVRVEIMTPEHDFDLG